MELFPQGDSPPDFFLQKRVYQLVAYGTEYHHPHHHTDAAQSLETEDIPPSAQIVNQSVFLKTPNPTVFTKYQTVAIDVLYPETDIVEGAEAEGLLHDHGIQGQRLDGVALDKQTITDVLEISKHLCLVSTPYKGDRSGETDVLGVVTSQTPLSKQVASLASLLTRGQYQHTEQEDR